MCIVTLLCCDCAVTVCGGGAGTVLLVGDVLHVLPPVDEHSRGAALLRGSRVLQRLVCDWHSNDKSTYSSDARQRCVAPLQPTCLALSPPMQSQRRFPRSQDAVPSRPSISRSYDRPTPRPLLGHVDVANQHSQRGYKVHQTLVHRCVFSYLFSCFPRKKKDL
eukprot:1195876-Prorocentrum_minimum.AAC.2